MTVQTHSAPERTTTQPTGLRKRLLPFTGLIPVVLMVPVLAFNLYGLAIVLALVSGAGVISYHVSRGQGVSSLDVILLCFGALNAVLYFGFDNTVLLDHIDAVIYTLLAAHATGSLFRDPPWTTQFTKRTVPQQAWELPEFRAVNRFSTAIWAACFAACDVIALAAGDPLRLYLPIALMVLTALLSRRLARAGVPGAAARRRRRRRAAGSLGVSAHAAGRTGSSGTRIGCWRSSKPANQTARPRAVASPARRCLCRTDCRPRKPATRLRRCGRPQALTGRPDTGPSRHLSVASSSRQGPGALPRSERAS